MIAVNHIGILLILCFNIYSLPVIRAEGNSDCPLDCYNQGKCDIHSITGEFFCECALTSSGGFQGVRCETPFLQCTDNDKRGWRCLNGGHCQSGESNEVCQCPKEFTGQLCQTFTGPDSSAITANRMSSSSSSSTNLSGGAIFGIVIASVIMATALFVVGFLVGRNGSSQPQDPSMAPSKDLTITWAC